MDKTRELFQPGRASELRQTLRRAVEGGTNTDKPGRCRGVMLDIARNHQITRESDPNRCTQHPGHPILQTALYLSFDYLLEDTNVIAALLTEVYQCEKTFERVFAGAIFGIGASYFITGWKSEFQSKTDNITAVEYFLQHATKSRLTFDGYRLGEVPLKHAGLPPLEASLQVGNLDMAFLLVKFGVGVGCYPCLSPPRLLLLCKIRIWFILNFHWELPFGLGKLPLPPTLISYLETVDIDLLPPGR